MWVIFYAVSCSIRQARSLHPRLMPHWPQAAGNVKRMLGSSQAHSDAVRRTRRGRPKSNNRSPTTSTPKLPRRRCTQRIPILIKCLDCIHTCRN
ncbi:hypothetical protein HYDPIDRAFT_115526 [Hydnomerulius pinastri MD-312]|uniref:Uncharacterized protein n=1 Tax=Hydnomerulius pinastri MD-312 TaxID=994086 RepID=A0A0C9V7V8_9AGAM|nr:hypothetical protein HYDPIDRAFT_115526 [Hydnomerulius pinastri MD-312]